MRAMRGYSRHTRQRPHLPQNPPPAHHGRAQDRRQTGAAAAQEFI